MICERCDGDGWVEVFGDEGFPIGARECEKCSGSGSITPFDPPRRRHYTLGCASGQHMNDGRCDCR